MSNQAVVKIRFFASIREQLGVETLSCPLSPDVTTVGALQQQLVADQGGRWAEVLLADNVIRAVNHAVVGCDHQLVDGDEVAFFPPVTGG